MFIGLLVIGWNTKWEVLMLWSTINFGKFFEQSKTLPQIVLADPDWFFHMHDNEAFLGGLARQADDVAWKAQHIRIPGKSPRKLQVQYHLSEDSRKFAWLEIVAAAAPYPLETPIERRDFLDLSFPRSRCNYDKRGGRRIIKELKLGNAHLHFTKVVCERFFADRRNFGYQPGD